MSTTKTGIRTNADGTVSVYLRYSNGRGASYRINTGVKVPSKAYRDKDGSWITDKVANHIALNQVIKNKIAEVDKFVAEYMRDHSGHSPSVDEMREWHTKPKKNGEIGFAELWNEFIADITRSGKVKKGRLSQYKVTLLKVTTLFPDLRMCDIGTNFIYDFNDSMVSAGLQMNTRSSNFSRLKAFLKWCINEGKYNVPVPAIRRIIVKHDDRDIVFLTDDDLRKVYEYSLIAPDALRDVAHSMLLQCFVGMRFGDIKPERWSYDSDFLYFVPDKTRHSTGVKVSVPLAPEAAYVLNYYAEQGKSFPKFSMGYYNRAVKIVCRDAGITQKVLILKGRKQFKAGDWVEKCDLISSHSFRATFVCRMANNNVPDRLIGEMAGITLNTLKHYLSVNNDTLKSAMDSVTRKVGDLTVHVNKSKTA